MQRHRQRQTERKRERKCASSRRRGTEGENERGIKIKRDQRWLKRRDDGKTEIETTRMRGREGGRLGGIRKRERERERERSRPLAKSFVASRLKSNNCFRLAQPRASA